MNCAPYVRRPWNSSRHMWTTMAPRCVVPHNCLSSTYSQYWPMYVCIGWLYTVYIQDLVGLWLVNLSMCKYMWQFWYKSSILLHILTTCHYARGIVMLEPWWALYVLCRCIWCGTATHVPVCMYVAFISLVPTLSPAMIHWYIGSSLILVHVSRTIVFYIVYRRKLNLFWRPSAMMWAQWKVKYVQNDIVL